MQKRESLGLGRNTSVLLKEEYLIFFLSFTTPKKSTGKNKTDISKSS
jgi:hypothetical protein